MAQWGRIRQGYMAGKSYQELADKYGLSVKTIQNRASKEGWTKEKGKIKEEVGEKIHERVVRVRVRELEKLMDANGKLIDTLVSLTEQAADENETRKMIFDKAGSMKNVECLAKAIRTAVETQRDLYKLPTLDQETKQTELLIKSTIDAAKADLEREKWEAEKLEKAKSAEVAGGTVWQIKAPEGMVLDG